MALYLYFIFNVTLTAYVAQSYGSKDPFKLPAGYKETLYNKIIKKFDSTDYQLKGIVTGNPNKALFLSPEGESLLLNEGDKLGFFGDTISKILPNEVILAKIIKDGTGKETQNEISIKIDE